MTNEPAVDRDVETRTRDCLMCGRTCVVTSERGAILIKEPCPNKCSTGYVKQSSPTRKG